MADRDRPVYCTQCGSIVNSEDNFCGVCGAAVPPSAPDAAPTQEIPTLVSPPSSATAGNRNRRLAMLIGAGVVLILVLGIGSVAALTLLRSEANPLKPTDRKEAAGAPETTASRQND